MGVAGLWEVLRPAAEVRSLTQLAVTEGFIANSGGRRGFRIGIDASIWFFHAAYGREGENPELRTLFFRCCRLLQTPLLPLFVFDGPKRPAVKRGKRVGGNAHWLTTGMKNIIQAFGFEWRTAPGEAEAELAYLNRIGVIDAVLSDDVDNFLFGATMVIRNPSNTLSGNRSRPVTNSEGRDDGNHVQIYQASSLSIHPSVKITRPGAILIALLSGGDYIPAGLPGCGKGFATGLARAGFGESLVEAATTLTGDKLENFLSEWRNQIKAELKSNKGGFLPSKKPSLAASLPDSFPSIPVLLSYVSPITSETERPHHAPPPVSWPNDPDPAQIASLCELYFEWGVKDIIIKRFRTVLWPGVMCRVLRRGAMDRDQMHEAGLEPVPDNCLTSGPALITSGTVPTATPCQGRPSTSKKTTAKDIPFFHSTPFSLASFPLVASTSCPSMPADNSEKSDNDKTCTSLLIDIVSIREHSSTDRTPEYRVLIDPTALVDRAASGVRGIRPPLDVPSASDDLGHAEHGGEEVEGDEAATDNDEVSERLETAAQAKAKKTTKRTRSTPASPTEPLRLWLPAVMVHAVAPDLVNGYEEKLRKRALKKIQKGTKGKALDKASTTCNAIGMDTTDGDSIRVARSTKLKATAPIVGTSIGRGRRKPNGIAELQDEGYEYFDLNDASPCSEGDSDDRSRVPPAARKKKTATVKMPSQSKSTVKDFFSTTKPSTSTVTTTTRSSAFVPKLPSSIYDELDEDPPHKPLTATNLTSTRPLDIICSRTKEKSRDSLKRRSKSLVRKPLAYVEVSSDEIEIDENKLSGNTTAPSTSPIRKRTDEKEDTSSKQGKPQALVTNFFVASKRANESDSKARSKGTVAISGSKLTHIHLPYAEKELSDSDQDTGKNNRKESRDIAHLNPPRGRPAPRPFPIPPPNIAASSVGSEGGAGTTEDMGVFNAPLASVLPSPLTCSRSSPSYEEVLSDSDGSKILPTAKSPQISVTQTLPSYCANRRSSGSLSTVSFGLRDHGATIRPLSEDIEGCGSVDRSEQVIDETVIYISSGSDEEMDDTGADGADVGMILSAPPALSEPESEPRPSKFKPAVGPITKVTKEATRGEYKVPETMLAPTQIAEKEAKNLGSRQKLNDISVGVTKANIPPLLVARAKADANRAASKASVSTKSTKPTHNARPKLLISEDDFIDLT